MGRLLEFEMGLGELSGELWQSIWHDTIVWGEPSDKLKAERRTRRERLFKDSAVPWIMQDLDAILDFYDNLQDIASFALWNKRLVGARGLAGCMKRNAAEGRTGLALLTKCLCPFGKKEGKRRAKRSGPMNLLLEGPLMALFIRFFPGTAPIMWALLAGQVLATAVGYGISFGPLVGASMELFYRGLAELGLPFGREHNKWYQLKQARALWKSDKGVAASRYLDWEDRLLAIVGLRLAWRDNERLPEFIVKRDDYPKFTDIYNDPLGLMGTLAGMFGSFVPNVAAYMVNDFFVPLIEDIGHAVSGNVGVFDAELNGNMRAAMAMLEEGGCPGDDACEELLEDAMALTQWGMDEGVEQGTNDWWRVLLDFFSNWFSGYGLSGLLLKQPEW